MKLCAAISALVLLTCGSAHAWLLGKQAHTASDYRQLTEVKPLPVALDRNFEFRKTKLFFLGEAPGGATRAGNLVRGGPRDPAVGFEGAYRLYGAVTALDWGRRFGHYFDFYWRNKRPANVTVRLEYRQQNLRAATQAREVSYANTKGSHRTTFAVIGDDFHTDGRVLSWRCLLIENGRIVAEDRSYLWR